METRFSRFIRSRNRRARMSGSEFDGTTSSSTSNAIHSSRSTSSQGSPVAKRPSFFSSQPRIHHVSTSHQDLGADIGSLRSISYDSCTTGKPPTFIGKAQPGNGPIKLQANRRLSSGELIATTEEGALKDIREGEYVVGRKERSASRSQPSHSVPNLNVRPPLAIAPSLSSPHPSPLSATLSPTQNWPTISSPDFRAMSPRSEPVVGTDVFTTSPNFHTIPPSFTDPQRAMRNTYNDFSFSMLHPSASRDSLASQRTSYQDNRATLVALKKAEYSRLMNLYGPETATLNLSKTVSAPTSPMVQSFSTIVLDPMHLAHFENHDKESARASHVSGTTDSAYEESSSASSPQRTSFVSSHAGSFSTTPHTSITDEEYTASREDIRSMVEQIRSTYLDAFDAHAPPRPSPKPRKMKKSNRASSNTLAVAEKQKLKSPLGRQTWHAHNQQQEVFSRPRVNSQPVSGTGRLPPIPASPPRDTDMDVGIKRADSTTLGELMADMTRTKIKSQASKPARESTSRNFSRPSTPRFQQPKSKESWLDLGPDFTDDSCPQSPSDEPPCDQSIDAPSSPASVIIHSHTISTGPQDHVEVLYQDLFAKEIDDLWQSPTPPPQQTSISRTTPSDNDHYCSQFSTPRKKSPFASIPESPEYTHLADPSCPSGRPI